MTVPVAVIMCILMCGVLAMAVAALARHKAPPTLVPHVKHVPRVKGTPLQEAYRQGWQDACMKVIGDANAERSARVTRAQSKTEDGVLVLGDPDVDLQVSLVDVASGAEHILRSCPK